MRIWPLVNDNRIMW